MKAAIYCRLSKEDEYKIGESESIQNQKSMLIQYAIEKGFDIYQIYSDEDYSGIPFLEFRICMVPKCLYSGRMPMTSLATLMVLLYLV